MSGSLFDLTGLTAIVTGAGLETENLTLRLIPEYIVLVLILGAARAWLFPHIGPSIDNSLLWIVANDAHDRVDH